MARAVGAILVLVLAASGAFAGGAGTTGGVGLKLPAAARPTGMGAAFVGLADDANALLWNPAGLSFVSSPEVSLLHTMYLAQTSYQILGYAQPLPLLGTVAASINSLDYGKVPRTSERSNGLYGGVTGSNAPQDYYITLGWGDAMPPVFGLDKIRAGVSLKTTVQQLSAGTKYGAGLTGGALWDSPVPGLRAGMVLDNLGASGAGVLPFVWALGGSYNRRLGRDFTGLFALDACVPIDTGLVYNMGAELTGFEIVMVRAGWRGGGVLGGPSLGFGVKYPAKWLDRNFVFKLDYAMASSGELGTSQRFQLSVQLGGGTAKPVQRDKTLESAAPAVPSSTVLQPVAPVSVPSSTAFQPVASAAASSSTVFLPVSYQFAPSSTVFRPVVPGAAPSSTVFRPVAPGAAPSSTVFRPVVPGAAPSSTMFRPVVPGAAPSSTVFRPVAPAAAPSSTVFRPVAPVAAPSSTVLQPVVPVPVKPGAQPKK